MRSSNDEVQSAAIQGLMKVVGSKAAATTFISGATFPALLSVCRTRGSKVRPGESLQFAPNALAHVHRYLYGDGCRGQLQSLLSAALARILEAVSSQERVVDVRSRPAPSVACYSALTAVPRLSLDR